MAVATTLTLKQEQSVKEERSWKDMPNELLCEVYSRVYAVDRFVFRSTCRSWTHVRVLTTPRFQLPLTILGSHSPYLLFQRNKLYHPIYDTYHRLDFSLNKPGAIVNVAKDGWLLMTYNASEFFLYNLTTKTIVELPELDFDGIRSMWFSAPPTSKGWRVVVAKTNLHKQIALYCIKDGEQRWNVFYFAPRSISGSQFKFSNCNAVMHKGMYYFLGKQAELLVYCPKKNVFTFHKACKSIGKYLKAHGGQEYMLETVGKLLAVFVNCDGSLINIFQWSVVKKKWGILRSLGDRMLFVSAISSISERSCIRGTGNKIYFPRFVGNQSLFYSLHQKNTTLLKAGLMIPFMHQNFASILFGSTLQTSS